MGLPSNFQLFLLPLKHLHNSVAYRFLHCTRLVDHHPSRLLVFLALVRSFSGVDPMVWNGVRLGWRIVRFLTGGSLLFWTGFMDGV
jgi:hypothetical protein